MSTEQILSVTSASFSGLQAGSKTVFTQRYTNINVPGQSEGRGFQVVVFDEATLQVLDAVAFDGWGNVSELEKFALFLNEIPTGRIVAVAVKDAVTNNINLPDSASLAIKSIGGTKMAQITGRIAWCLIGRKGALDIPIPNSIQESLGTNTASVTTKLISVTASSAGLLFGNFAYITVNGVRYPPKPTRGIHVVTLDASLTVTTINVFDTYGNIADYERFQTFIQNLPPNTYVALAAMDTAISPPNPFSSKLVEVLRSIGSLYGGQIGFRESWAFIGRKGAPIGSPIAKEAYSRTGAATVSLFLNAQ